MTLRCPTRPKRRMATATETGRRACFSEPLHPFAHHHNCEIQRKLVDVLRVCSVDFCETCKGCCTTRWSDSSTGRGLRAQNEYVSLPNREWSVEAVGTQGDEHCGEEAEMQPVMPSNRQVVNEQTETEVHLDISHDSFLTASTSFLSMCDTPSF